MEKVKLEATEVKEKNHKLKDGFRISNCNVEGRSFVNVIHRKQLEEEAVSRGGQEVEVEAAKAKMDKGRMKEEIKRIKEENRRITNEKVVEQGIKGTHRGRVREVEDICNNNERGCVGEETTLSVSISEDTVGWLLGNSRRALTFIQQHCNVSINVQESKRGDGRRVAVISGSLRGVSKAGEIVKLDVGEPRLVLTDVGAKRLRRDRPRVEER